MVGVGLPPTVDYQQQAVSAPTVAPASGSESIFTIRNPDGTYSDCSGSTPLHAGLYVDSCYHAGIALVAHDWSYGAVFKQLRVGQHFTYRGRSYVVRVVKVVTPEQQFMEFNATADLLLMTCSGALRWVVEAY